MKVLTGVASEDPERLADFRKMVEAGAYRSVIDQQFPLDQIRDAHRVVDGGHKQGNVVVTVGAEQSGRINDPDFEGAAEPSTAHG